MWGGDGDADFFGCLNMLTPERVVAAAGLVRKGAVFALNWSMGLPDPPLFGRQPFTHEVTGHGASTSHDDVLHNWNTQSSSQWDGFRHIRNHAARADEPGSGHFAGVEDADHGIDHWARRGLVGRAVLADIARWRESIGRPLQYGASDPIDADEIGQCLAAQSTVLQEGDVLLVRTGWVGWYEGLDADARAALAEPGALATPGFRSGEHLAEYLWDLHIAAIGCDNPAVEVWPPGAQHPGARSRGAGRAEAPARDLHPHPAAADARPAAGGDVDAGGSGCRLRRRRPLRVHVHLCPAEPAPRRGQPAQRAGDQIGGRAGPPARRPWPARPPPLVDPSEC